MSLLWSGKPTREGFYIVRGFTFDDLSQIAMVEVAFDGDLVCNLHGCNSTQPSDFRWLLSDIDEDFEWMLLSDVTRSALNEEL